MIGAGFVGLEEATQIFEEERRKAVIERQQEKLRRSRGLALRE